MYSRNSSVEIKGEREIALMREVGRLAAGTLERVGPILRAGITTQEINDFVHADTLRLGARPAPLNYKGFPKSVCTSINEVVCHGIPDDTELLDGDIINVDITAYLDGVHGDLNATFFVGDVDPETVLLVDRTREALARGIRAVAPGREINVIGRAIESYARRFGYGVVRDFTGHGVGESFHSGLIVPHYDAAPAFDTVMEPGMVFTIEPMLTMGTPEHPGIVEWDEWPDEWTVTTRDRSLTAQFEHTLVVTERGSELLTLPTDGPAPGPAPSPAPAPAV